MEVNNHNETPFDVICIGAGPACLTAGYLLSKEQKKVCLLEADPDYVGGISRTVKYKGYHFDIGGHRFFSKSKEVEDLWSELLPNDMLDRPRKSRIFYRRKFFSYPLKAVEALLNLGILESILCVLSYFWAQINPVPEPKNFEDWVSNKFGKRLFGIFFKTYTEKVWGMNCKDISADWAAQRIKGLSLWTAIINAVWAPKKSASTDKSEVIKTLIDSFRYPRKGPGMMWEAAASRILAMGNDIKMGQFVTGISFDSSTKLWQVTSKNLQGEISKRFAKEVISSAPMKELILGLTPKPSEKCLAAANGLKYRDFLTVAVMVKDRDVFDDNWIYIHEPNVKVGRIQNFKSWSPELVPNETHACYGLEYFCFEGDHLWDSTDDKLIELAKRELESLNLAKGIDVVDGTVVRQPKAYPVYDDVYSQHVKTIRETLKQSYPGLHLVGRNGMHKYNNQDHAMMTAMLTVQNILAGKELYNIWEVNEDAEYHEAGHRGEDSKHTVSARLVPTKV